MAPIVITMSVGISAADGAAAATDLAVKQLQRADQTLYARKHAGRHRAIADQVTTSK